MSDHIMEWKIQGGEEDGDGVVEEKSKMSLILNKGWTWGKRVVITGMVISSAPIVLPPLMIYSTIGFAFAVPFGFVFASYACTEKLMSKLLSRPLPPTPMLENQVDDDGYYGYDYEEAGVVDDADEKEGGISYGFDGGEEEEKFEGDTKDTLEMRIELVGDEQEKLGEDMNGVTEEESQDSAWVDNYGEEVVEEEKPADEYAGDIEKDNLVAETGDVEDYGDEQEDDAIIIEEEDKLVHLLLGGSEEDEKVIRDAGGPRDDDDGVDDDVIGFDERAVNGNVGSIEQQEEKRPAEDTEGVVEETGDEKNVVVAVERVEKPVVGEPIRVMEGVFADSRDDESLGTIIVDDKGTEEYIVDDGNTLADILVDIEEEEKLGRKINGMLEESVEGKFLAMIEEEEKSLGAAEELMGEGNYDDLVEEAKKHLEVTGENMEEEERPITEINGDLEERRDEETLDKTGEEKEKVQEQIAEQSSNEQYINVAAQKEDYIVEEEKKPIAETNGDSEGKRDEESLDKTKKEEVKVQEQIAEQSGNEQHISDAAQKEDYIVEEEVPVVEINGVIEENKGNDRGVNFAESDEVRQLKGTQGVEKEVELTILEAEITPEEKGREESVKGVPQESKPIEGMARQAEEGRFDEVVDKDQYVVAKPVKEIERNGVIGKSRDEGILDSMPEEEKKPVVEIEKRTTPSQTENAMEVADESGIHFSDEETADADHYTINAGGTYEDEAPLLNKSSPLVSMQDDGADSLPQHVSLEHAPSVEEDTLDELAKEMKESVPHPATAEMTESKSTKVASEQESIIPSKEVILYSEEKIWEHIEAMRKIVGYKATLQANCVEELKALYVFTGVEPPFAFKDPSDLAEINDKLRLLMSIIGVK